MIRVIARQISEAVAQKLRRVADWFDCPPDVVPEQHPITAEAEALMHRPSRQKKVEPPIQPKRGSLADRVAKARRPH